MVAVYGNQALYKDYAVMVVPPLMKVSSDRNNNRHNGQQSDNHRKTDFSKILDEMSNSNAAEVSYHTTGYTKDAVAFYTVYQTRDYNYMFKS